MEGGIFYIIAVIGLLLITIGTLMIRKIKIKRKYIYILLMAGGICLEIYSIYIKDLIFIILQGIFIISAGYGLIKTGKNRK
jgi:lipid-A-disaccharide synthase-like uncharacterized protein